MNNNIPLILTTAVTISTIIYTFYSIQLWRTTQAAAEISRQAALGNLWTELNRYLEILRQQDAPETALIQKLSDLFLEFMIANLLTSAVEKNDQNFEEFRPKGFGLSVGKRSSCFENPVGRTNCRAEEASLISLSVATSLPIRETDPIKIMRVISLQSIGLLEFRLRLLDFWIKRKSFQ